MHKVYGHALCNISAAGATDTEQNLFLERLRGGVAVIEEIQVRVDDQMGDTDRKAPFVMCDVWPWSKSVSETPLYDGGWVFQKDFWPSGYFILEKIKDCVSAASSMPRRHFQMSFQAP